MNAAKTNAAPIPPVGWIPNQTAPVNGQPSPAPMQTPIQAQVPSPQQPPAAQPKPQGSGAEQVIGRTVLGIVAASLVFLGIVYFGIALIPQLTDEVKVMLMFGISLGIVAAGGVLAVKRGGAFASALMGCGACSLFASTFIAQIHFGLINDVLAYVILLAWMVICLAFISETKSVLLAVVLQLGLALSVWFAYVDGAGADNLGLLLLYQTVATVIVVGGNMLFHPKMYRPSLVLALVLNLSTSLFIQFYHGVFGLFDASYVTASYPWVAVSLGVQLVAAALLVGMLSKGAFDGEVAYRAGQIVRPSSTSSLVVAAIAWFFAVKLDAQFAVAYCLQNSPSSMAPTVLSAGSAILLLVATVFLLAAYARKLDLDLSSTPLAPAVAIIITGIVLTALEASVDGGGIWTVCCMACAFACIGAGFRFRVNWLRLYGLVAVLVCVAKLVLVDLYVYDPAIRAASLIAGGLICFAISALYTFAQRRQSEEDANAGLAQ